MRGRGKTCILIPVTALIVLMYGCTQSGPSHELSWTYNRTQIQAGLDRANGANASDGYRDLGVLFSVMANVCLHWTDCESVQVLGVTSGVDGAEFSQVVFNTLDQNGSQITSAPYTVPNRRFSVATLERLNREIGLSR